jgi:plasmid maintenance system antidote protein VapI
LSRGVGKLHPRHKEYAAEVSQLLRAELDRAGITPYHLAHKMLKIHRSNIHLLVTGQSLPTPGMIMMIARRLGIPVSRLLPRRIRA